MFDRPVSLTPDASANPPPRSKTTLHGNLDCIVVQSISLVGFFDFRSSSVGFKSWRIDGTSAGKMNIRRAIILEIKVII
jgi:hypothetical protein